MPLEKIPAILLSGVGVYISLTTPTPSKPKNERRVREGLVEAQWLVGTIKTGYWTYAIIELCIIVAGAMESTWSKGVLTLLLPNGEHADCIKLTPTTTFATILIVLGAAIRYWCYREMGKHFTFHVTLLQNHKLVTTGPYNIVRHPSYTGGIFIYVGIMLWYTAQGSWLRESMIYQMKLAWLIIAPVLLTTSLCLAISLGRIPVEDAILKKEFGKDWDKWAKAVPYQLFPGLL